MDDGYRLPDAHEEVQSEEWQYNQDLSHCTECCAHQTLNRYYVSASSSTLKKNLVCNGFVNGWTEFGIIRAYLNDDRLDDNLKNYLIASTRMTYALYGVADISVHAGGWGEAEVTDLCTTYFGEAGGSSYGSSVYQMVLKNPGKYAAAAIDYLQITEIESTMAANQGENYSEANLLDLLFNQGP